MTRTPPRLLVVDDHADSLEFLRDRLVFLGYEVLTASTGAAALEAARTHLPDLILLDVVMPGMSGLEVCRTLKQDPALPFMPVILTTALTRPEEVVAGLEAGADEYVTKPIEPQALAARVRSMLRIKTQHDTLAEMNRRLRLFLAPQVAELIAATDDQPALDTRRREISVLFCDLRGYTRFVSTSPPERVMAVLREYHEHLGPLIAHYQGTLERFVGDGLVVFFNDPLPCPNPTERAVRLGLDMQTAVAGLAEQWRRRYDCTLGFGVGIDHDYASVGRVGYEGRYDYAAIGPVTNRAARLCERAQDGQVLISRSAYAQVEDLVDVEPLGSLDLKGFPDPVNAFNVRGVR